MMAKKILQWILSKLNPPPLTADKTLENSLEERTRDLEARVRQLTALREIEEAAIQRPEEEAILTTCLQNVARGLSFDRTGLYWVDYAKQQIVGRHLFGIEPMGFS